MTSAAHGATIGSALLIGLGLTIRDAAWLQQPASAKSPPTPPTRGSANPEDADVMEPLHRRAAAGADATVVVQICNA